MDDKHFKETEKQDFEKLKSFNKVTNLFKELGYTGDFYFDATAYTRSRKTEIELKTRNAILTDNLMLSSRTFVDEYIMIETDKIFNLQVDSRYDGILPLYINFLDNCIIISNLENSTIKPKRIRTQINNVGYKGVEKVNRIGIHLKDCCIYSYDGKLIKRQGEECGMRRST